MKKEAEHEHASLACKPHFQNSRIFRTSKRDSSLFHSKSAVIIRIIAPSNSDINISSKLCQNVGTLALDLRPLCPSNLRCIKR